MHVYSVSGHERARSPFSLMYHVYCVSIDYIVMWMCEMCQLLRIEGVAWSAQRIPTAVFPVFYTGTATISSK
jgi:hypothetical protein